MRSSDFIMMGRASSGAATGSKDDAYTFGRARPESLDLAEVRALSRFAPFDSSALIQFPEREREREREREGDEERWRERERGGGI